MTKKIQKNKADYLFAAIFPSSVGNLGIRVRRGKLAALCFLPQDAQLFYPNNTQAQDIVDEIRNYFDNPRHQFDFGLYMEGTTFQLDVWEALQDIPSGEVVSYKNLARDLRTSARAIGNACRANPMPIIIPCHRVVSESGIGGYCGTTEGALIDVKQWLLKHEDLSYHTWN